MQKTTGTKKPASAKSEPAPAAAAPKFDLRSMLEGLRMPGLDVSALMDSRRKDVEALIAANQRAYQGFEALTRRQAEILAEGMKAWQEGAKEMIGPASAGEKATRSASRAQEAFGHALSNMRELAEMAAKSQQEVVGIINKRVREGIQEFREQFTRKP